MYTTSSLNSYALSFASAAGPLINEAIKPIADMYNSKQLTLTGWAVFSLPIAENICLNMSGRI